MFGRPRCREWTPLTTQQLRLRSLIQIVGYNIRPPESCLAQCSFYLTLHHTTMSAPFYTSERISSPHPKWKEIDSEITQRMSSTNVVIRIWCHIIQNKEKLDKPDSIIETWGVYFSGLRYIGANLASNFTSDCFKSNTLVFQMHGGYFCSYKSLQLDIIPPENEIEHGSISSDSSGKTTLSKIVLEPKFIRSNNLKESRSISPSKYSRKSDKEYSKSQSPIERGFKQNFPTIKTSTSLNISQRVETAREHQIYEDPSSDVKEYTTSEENCDNITKTLSNEDFSASNIDLSETAENYDLRNEGDMPKYRYQALSFLKSEIRQSYNASKLQRLHLLQYSIKKKQDSVQEIKENIYKKSAMSHDSLLDQNFDCRVKIRDRSQRNLFSPDDSEVKALSENVKNGKVVEKPVSNGPRLALKLNDLLSYKIKPSPFQRSEHVRLTKQIEILRFKRIILSDERDSKLACIRKLKERHAKLYEENQDVGLDLMESYHTLSRRNDSLKETRQSCDALRELAARAHASLNSRRCELLKELLTVFHIEQQDNSTWKILNIPLPICSDDNPSAHPQIDSIAAGYVAQVTCLTGVLLNQPLRYKITLLGSASKILDTLHVFSDPNIPLFARSGDVPLFRYGLFLLNKCIAQLLWNRGVVVTDIGPTLANLFKLLTLPANLTETSKLFGTYHWLSDSQCPRTQSLRSLVASEKKYRQFNRFKDAVDGQSPQNALNIRRHRHSRSVGSYNDYQDPVNLDTSTTSLMGSDSDIYNTKLTQENLELQQRLLKCHSSDTNISRISENIDSIDKVTFTLGGESSIDVKSLKLVRMSSNNDDISCTNCLDDNVKQVCSEINSFCMSNSSKDFQEHTEGHDIKYVRKCSSEIEEADIMCDSCRSNKDGDCDLTCVNSLTDVIVIPSAEAALDTGQNESELN